MRAALLSLVRNERGAVFTEYVVIVGFIGLVTLPAILFCALSLAERFVHNRYYALLPFP